MYVSPCLHHVMWLFHSCACIIVWRYAIGFALEAVIYLCMPLLIVRTSLFGAHRGHFQPFTSANEFVRQSGWLLTSLAIAACIATFQLIDPHNVPDLPL